MDYKERDTSLYELVANSCDARNKQQGLNIFTLFNATMSLKKKNENQ